MSNKATGRHQTISESMALALIKVHRMDGILSPENLSISSGIAARLRDRQLVVWYDGLIQLTELGEQFVTGETKLSKYRRPAKEWGPQVGIRDCLSGRYDYDRLMGAE